VRPAPIELLVSFYKRDSPLAGISFLKMNISPPALEVTFPSPFFSFLWGYPFLFFSFAFFLFFYKSKRIEKLATFRGALLGITGQYKTD